MHSPTMDLPQNHPDGLNKRCQMGLFYPIARTCLGDAPVNKDVASIFIRRGGVYLDCCLYQKLDLSGYDVLSVGLQSVSSDERIDL